MHIKHYIIKTLWIIPYYLVRFCVICKFLQAELGAERKINRSSWLPCRMNKSDTTNKCWSDDDGWVHVDLKEVEGFKEGFPWFGLKETKITIGTNGMITFGAPPPPAPHPHILKSLSAPSVPAWLFATELRTLSKTTTQRTTFV